MTDATAKRRLVLVTGMSGAGKTTVLKALEDLGFEAVDNMPLGLLPNLAAPVWHPEDSHHAPRPLAAAADIRTRDFDAAAFAAQLETLREQGDLDVQVVFVDCDDDELLHRYTETRHRHPLAQDRPVADGVKLERSLISPLIALADQVLDTTGRSPGDVKQFLARALQDADTDTDIALFVTSFSYRRGLPRDADLVFDVRFLQNPHYDPELRPLSGRDPGVARYIEADAGLTPFLDGIKGLIGPLFPRFAAEGKSYLTLAVGCTGGRHRSVYVAEQLAAWLEHEGRRVKLTHRDLSL